MQQSSNDYNSTVENTSILEIKLHIPATDIMIHWINVRLLFDNAVSDCSTHHLHDYNISVNTVWVAYIIICVVSICSIFCKLNHSWD